MGSRVVGAFASATGHAGAARAGEAAAKAAAAMAASGKACRVFIEISGVDEDECGSRTVTAMQAAEGARSEVMLRRVASALCAAPRIALKENRFEPSAYSPPASPRSWSGRTRLSSRSVEAPSAPGDPTTLNEA
ncbi:MAG: hypothetical protein M3Z16_04420, partial [Pseudomonadota bacterium]|nr:hypothetical protein [Pseudomonadota bacterium]